MCIRDRFLYKVIQAVSRAHPLLLWMKVKWYPRNIMLVRCGKCQNRNLFTTENFTRTIPWTDTATRVNVEPKVFQPGFQGLPSPHPKGTSLRWGDERTWERSWEFWSSTVSCQMAWTSGSVDSDEWNRAGKGYLGIFEVSLVSACKSMTGSL